MVPSKKGQSQTYQFPLPVIRKTWLRGPSKSSPPISPIPSPATCQGRCSMWHTASHGCVLRLGLSRRWPTSCPFSCAPATNALSKDPKQYRQVQVWGSYGIDMVSVLIKSYFKNLQTILKLAGGCWWTYSTRHKLDWSIKPSVWTCSRHP